MSFSKISSGLSLPGCPEEAVQQLGVLQPCQKDTRNEDILTGKGAFGP